IIQVCTEAGIANPSPYLALPAAPHERLRRLRADAAKWQQAGNRKARAFALAEMAHILVGEAKFPLAARPFLDQARGLALRLGDPIFTRELETLTDQVQHGIVKESPAAVRPTRARILRP